MPALGDLIIGVAVVLCGCYLAHQWLRGDLGGDDE